MKKITFNNDAVLFTEDEITFISNGNSVFAMFYADEEYKCYNCNEIVSIS